jgi:hypothetical protein
MHRTRRRLALGPVMVALIAVAGVVALQAGADISPAASASIAPASSTILLVGDSVPLSFANEFVDLAAEHGYALTSAAEGGCPATGVSKVYSSGAKFKNDTCAHVIGGQDAKIDKYRPALVVWWSRYELGPRVGPNGKALPLGSKAYLRAQKASFEERARALTSEGARLVTVQVEPPGPALAARNPTEKGFLVGQTLLHRPDVVKAWNAFLASHKGPQVFSVSVAGLICHNAKVPCDDSLPNGETARPDGVHYSATAQRQLAAPIFGAIWRSARLEPVASP